MSDTSERAAAAWAQLALLAHRVCEHIEKRQPDLIVPLHTSGALVWEAAAAVWEATRSDPLPRVRAANLCGKAVYTGAMEYEVDYPRSKVAGEFMAGLLRMRPQWPAALAAHLGVEVGDESVRRVLLVDDCVGHGDDLLAAGSLLLAVFPRAQVDLLAGLSAGWSTALAAAWLEEQHPTVAARMYEQWPADRQEFWRHSPPWEPAGAWGWLITGLAGVEDAPFASRPLAAEDCDWPYLRRYLPAAEWLQFVAWGRAEAVRQALAEHDPAAASLERRVWYGMDQEDRFYALTWGAPFFTAEELAERSGFAPEQVAKLLEPLALVTQEVDGRTVYSHARTDGFDAKEE